MVDKSNMGKMFEKYVGILNLKQYSTNDIIFEQQKGGDNDGRSKK